MSNSLWLHGLYHARLPCPSLSPGLCLNSCPLSWWYHPIISSSVIPFSTCPKSFPTLGSFPISQLFASGGQSTGASAPANSFIPTAPFIPTNIQDWFPLRLTSLISLLSENSQESSPAPQVECINCLWSTFFMVQFSLPYMTTGKAIAFAIWTFVGKVMSLLFNMLCRLIIAFLPKSKYLLISWLQSWSSVILEHREINSETVSIFPPVYLPRNDGKGCHDLSFFVCWVLSQLFHSLLSPSSRGSLVPLCFLPLRWCHIWGYWYFSWGILDSSLYFIQHGILHDLFCI